MNELQLHRFIRQGITAESLAEPLVSFDSERDAGEVRLELRERDFDIAGIRQAGVVTGEVRREDLINGRCGDWIREIPDEAIVSSYAPVPELLTRIERHGHLFVLALGSIAGIITYADLQKAPVRMWLFGLITMIEQSITESIRLRYREEYWRSMLSPTRVGRAEELQQERRRRNESRDLVDCLQFGDKAWILFKEKEIRDQVGFTSRRVARQRVASLEKLRNRLAHAQDMVTEDLETIVRLALGLDTVLEMISGLEGRGQGDIAQ
ncbi:MAG: hypothetical protein GY906_33285 [bacterium]|nr:hypothetical protein [bacterium]